MQAVRALACACGFLVACGSAPRSSAVVAPDPKLDALSEKLDALTRTVEAQAETQAQLETQLEAMQTKLDAMQTPSPTVTDTEKPVPPPFEGATCSVSTGRKRSCTLTRTSFDKLLADPTRLAKQARIVPMIRDEQTRGYKLYGIRRGSLPKALGIKNGDTLVAVDGNRMTSLDQAMDVYNTLRDAKTLTMDFERRGEPYTLVLSIVDEP